MALFNYESEQIFEKVHGDNIPQGKHFVSDCKQELLNGLTPNYPQLSDYEQEWLYFGDKVYVEGQPVNLEYATFEGTKGQINNAIPFNYKRAILNGLTLVNLFDVDDSLSLETFNSRWKYMKEVINLKGGNKYYFYFFNKLNNLPLHIKPLAGDTEKAAFNLEANTGKIVTLDSTVTTAMAYYYFKDGWTKEESRQNILDNCKILIIEYQEGLENLELPYFEGMKSFDNHLVTTTGKNLFDKSFILGNINSTGNIVQSTSNIISNAIKVKGDTTYSISRVGEFIANSKLYVIEYDENMNLIKTGLKTPFTTSSNCKYVRIQINGTTDIGTLNELMQIEEGPTATTYEPYQQHQVRINDDITLRSVGDTHDELNLLTGELTERIGEVVFDGSENWVEEATLEITQVFRYTPYLPIKGNNQIIYDTLPTGTTGDSERLVFDGSKTFYIAINKTKANTVDELKTWLQSNPITVQYVHATESVKSIEVNTPSPYEGTNYYTSTTPLVLECPVVSTGAKTLNEISQDE